MAQATRIDGKKLAEQILLELRYQVTQLPKPPALAAILIGDDKSSALFVKRKKEACRKVGIEFHEYICGQDKFLPDITQDGINDLLDFLSADDTIDAMIVQLPLPEKFNTQKIIRKIDPKKDVDGFHPDNYDELVAGRQLLTPPLILAINHVIEHTGEGLNQKNIIIVAKSDIFSVPLKVFLEQRGGQVKIISSDDKQLNDHTIKADILISVIGRKHSITKDMVKPDSIVIDVGTTLEQVDGKNKLYGDMHPDVEKVAKWFTPVPGGVGPLTVAMLLYNVVEIARQQRK